ncbi:sigma E factor regulatory protein [Jeongeupia sp. HS-3]|uniref:MucB/RseB C-terminal domain-containing protein n=1 Tax=Jeongeupia sp. HS-3 TaxID=1009682 RepID=UPI0018A377A4|nr:MucB/RseB C-terminal domain-containing protein [Jeongeupia sp. HS-3]BCL75003.1 sigma E factor regulatory protein [Jeongeupia sp. HS-3]
MMTLKGWLFAGSLLFVGSSLSALAAPPGELLDQSQASQLVNRVADAPKTLTFQGIYIQQRHSFMQSYRVFHQGGGGADIERRESLDGPQLEYLRHGDQISVFTPGSRPVTVDRRHTSKMFPRQFPDPAEELLVNYQIRKIGRERVAGLEADIYDFEPRDRYRYPHRYWIDAASGLMLKTVMYGARREVTEVFSFSQINIGGALDKRLLKPVNPVRPVVLEQMPQPLVADPHWEVHDLPPGFKLFRQLKRNLPGKHKPVLHYLYADGLVTVSVFVEPIDPRMPQGLTHQNGISLFSRQVGQYMITALGEVPAETVQAFSQGFSLRPDVK